MEEREINMITYGSTTLTSYNTITKIEVYYYKSTSATSLSGGSWSTTKPTWENGKYIWQKIRTTYEGKLENGQYYSESDPVNITGQQGATGTAAYSYKLNSSDSIIGKTKDGEYTIKKITFSATYKQGTGTVSAYSGRFKIESTTNGSTWKTEYTSNGNEASKEFTIPDDIILIKCSLYQSDGTTVLLDIVTVPVVKDGVDAIGLRDSIPYYLASDKDTGITKLTQGWTRYRPQLTAEKKYLWVYYVSRYSEGTTEPELIEIKDDLVHFVNNGDESPVESCVVDIEPVQDLHGYDSPWPGGGGKNKFGDYTIVNGYVTSEGAIERNADNRTYIVPISAETTYSIKIVRTNAAGSTLNDDVQVGEFYSDERPVAGSSGGTRLKSGGYVSNLYQATFQTSSNAKWLAVKIGNINSTNVDATAGTVQIEVGSAVSETYSPYSNICPITGWTGCEVQRTGKNLCGGLDLARSFERAAYPPQFSIDTTTKTFTFTRADVFSGSYIGSIFTPKNKSRMTIFVTYSNTAKNDSIEIIYTDGTRMKCNLTSTNGEKATYRLVTSENKKVEGIILHYFSNGLTTVYYDESGFFEGVVASEDFVPYTRQTYSITFPTEAGTVYGGTLDVTKGELVVDRAIVDLGDYDWAEENEDLPGMAKARGGTSLWNIYVYNQYPVCSILKGDMPKSYRQVEEGCICFSNAEAFPMIRVRSQAFAGLTDAEIKTALSGVQCCLKIKEPFTYTLTPQEITMLTGQNHIFSDTGQTAISYYNNQTSTDPYVNYSLTSAFDASTDALDKAKEVAQDLADLGADLQAQIDGKIETWCQKTDPSTAWTTTELKNQHNGDLWYYTGESTSSYKNNTTYKYTASTNKWTAYSASTDLFDKIDTKASIYYGKPSAITQNLEVGDYLVDNTDGCSYRWDGSKWVKLTDYKTAIDNIEIGGRNLLLNTDKFDLHKHDDSNGGGTWIFSDDEASYTATTKSWARLDLTYNPNMPSADISSQPNMDLLGDTSITLSIEAKCEGECNGSLYFQPVIYGNNANRKYFTLTNPVPGCVNAVTLTENWQRYSVTVPADYTNTTYWTSNSTQLSYPNTGFGASIYWNSTGTVHVRKPKLERGQKATDWTPAPEDVDSSIATAQSTADTAIDRATATYGTSSTAAGTAEKAVSCSNFVLFNGVRIQVTFSTANTASAPTLNVNNTGAKAIYINKTVTSDTNLLFWTAGSKMEFVYDGTGWIAQNVPYALYGTCSTGASTAAKDVTCNEAVICKGTSISINMTNTNTAANATLNVGSTLAKDIYANGVKLTTNSRFNWRANTVQKFVFDGQVWRMDDDSVKALATAYITKIDEDGIMVHPEDDSNSGWAISDAIQLFKNGISYIKLWIENNIPKIRIGKEDQGHIVLDNDSVDVRNGDDILASFGATSVIGDENDWHQTIAANQITFAKGNDIITYISPDKLYTINAEVADAFYISNYSIRNASDGKLVIGLRRK